MSNSVLRRYTPPTCTLEISAKNSSLSRWADRTVLKHLRFRLHFDDPRLSQASQVTIQGDRTQLEALYEVVATYVQTQLGQTSDSAANRFTPADSAAIQLTAPTTELSLQPQGMTNHQLCLGSLATPTSGAVVKLSTTQLFDLITALDDYSSDAIALPNLGRPRWLTTPTSWARTAAAALVVLGLTTSLTKIFDGSYSLQSSAPITSQEASSADQQVATPVSPVSPEAFSESPAPAAESSDLKPLQPLPPLPPKASGLPGRPNLPTASLPPFPTGAPQISSRPSQPTLPLPAAEVSPTLPDKAAEAPPALPNRIDTPQETIILEAPASQNATPSIASSLPSFNDSASGGSGAIAPGASLRSRTPATDDVDAPRVITSDAEASAFDTIPQVAEARSFFQQAWSAPRELNQTLEYSLVLNPDGTLQQIIPLGQTASTYLDRTGIPLLDEPFVSPLSSNRTPKIRLVLSPDGQVRTFLESMP
ncbi:MAG: DUF4335 domain-containing protein [Cyanothece sp. SIO1E1]|nr:DUF4335 domain-containing protein [Cyanothece sp. SIO1E1]